MVYNLTWIALHCLVQFVQLSLIYLCRHLFLLNTRYNKVPFVVTAIVILQMHSEVKHSTLVWMHQSLLHQLPLGMKSHLTSFAFYVVYTTLELKLCINYYYSDYSVILVMSDSGEDVLITCPTCGECLSCGLYCIGMFLWRIL